MLQKTTWWQSMCRALRGALVCCFLTCPALAWAVPWSQCLQASSGMCFSNDHPGSNERISVLVIINNRGDDLYCIQYLGQTRSGRAIHFQAVYLDCGDSGPLES